MGYDSVHEDANVDTDVTDVHVSDVDADSRMVLITFDWFHYASVYTVCVILCVILGAYYVRRLLWADKYFTRCANVTQTRYK